MKGDIVELEAGWFLENIVELGDGEVVENIVLGILFEGFDPAGVI